MTRKIKTIKSRKAAAVAFTLSRNCDNGEVLEQSMHSRNAYHREYVVQSSITDIPFEEYIVLKEPSPGRYPAVDRTPYSAGQSDDASKVPTKDSAEDKGKDFKSGTKTPTDQMGKGSQMGSKKETPTPESQVQEVDAEEYDIDMGPEEEDTFEKDMEGILKSQKEAEDKIKSVENRFANLQSPTPEKKEKPQELDQLSNQHAIFDALAQSMQFAKAYDLGSIDVEKRFADFDSINEKQNRGSEERKKSSPPPSTSQAVEETFDHEEFLRDLSMITKPGAKEASNEIGGQETQSRQLSDSNAGKGHHYLYESQSAVMAHPMTDYSYAQNPALIAGIAVADAIQIGLGAAAIVQAQVSSTQGSFSLSCDYAQRLLTNEARLKMKGAQKPKQSYRRELFWIGELKEGFADASVVIEWEGNAYGEIGTAVIRRDILHSTEWTKSSANTTIKKIDRIPLPGTDPRTWPLVYTYEGTFDPYGNGYFEFSGEFEINAFGGLKFVRHEVVNRSLLEFAKIGDKDDYVRKGKDFIAQVPEIPKEQLDYLKSALP